MRGKKASSGQRLVREEVCQEAIRLTSLVAEHPVGDVPKTHALLALMLLTAARFATRLDDGGNLLLLKDQERGRWDQSMIARGMFHLAKSAAGEQITAYHLETGFPHATAPPLITPPRIGNKSSNCDDHLIGFDDSPVVALNRAVALAEVHGPQAGLDAVWASPRLSSLESYYLLYAVLGEFESRFWGNWVAARLMLYRKSLKLVEIKSEQVFLAKQLAGCESQRSGGPSELLQD